MRGFKIQWQKIDPGVKIPYGKLNRGQNIICKLTQFTMGFKISYDTGSGYPIPIFLYRNAYLYMYCRWRSSYQEGRDSICRFNLATFVYHNYIIEFDSRPQIRSTRYDFSFWNIEFFFNLYFSWNFINFFKFWSSLKIIFFGYFEIVLPPTHGIYLTPYPWYIDPPTYVISTRYPW